MANTLDNTLNKVGDAIEVLMGTKKTTPYTDINSTHTGQTCLERFGIEARAEHLYRNEWKRDLQYTKPLVDSEYMIQTEFKVSSYEDRLREQAEYDTQKEEDRKAKSAEKAKRKAEKKAEKEAKKAAKVQGSTEKPIEPVETIPIAQNILPTNSNFNLDAAPYRYGLSYT